MATARSTSRARAAGRQVGAADHRLAPADEDAQAEVARLLALDLLQRAQAHADGERLALGVDGFGGVGAGLQGGARPPRATDCRP